MYADKVTASMKQAMEETQRRREKQMAFNQENGIVPKTIIKELGTALGKLNISDKGSKRKGTSGTEIQNPKQLEKKIRKMEKEMREAARELNFEHAAKLRDEIILLREALIEL